MGKLNTKTVGAVGILCCLVALIFWGIFVAYKARTVQTPTQQRGLTTDEIAEGEHRDMDSSKSKGYQNGDGMSMKNNYDDLWAAMEEEVQHREDQPREPSPTTKDQALQALLGENSQQAAAAPAQPAQPSVRRTSGGSVSSRPRTQQERDDKVRHDYELATEIVQKMYGDQLPAEGTNAPAVQDPQAEQPQRITVAGTPKRSSGSMDDWGSGTLSSLDDEQDVFSSDEVRPFRCMFIREEKIRNGQRVTLRLLEDVVVDGTVIPKNAHLSGVCSIKDRLYVSVSSFEMNGHIRTLDLEGYDTDGALGIYCPDVNNSAAKTAVNDAMNIGQAAVRGSVGSVASSVLRTGASIMRSSIGNDPAVTVPSGYTIYLMKTKRR